MIPQCRGINIEGPGVSLKDPGVLLKEPGVLLEDPGVLLNPIPPGRRGIEASGRQLGAAFPWAPEF